MKKLLKMIVIALSVLVLVTGCGDGSSSNDTQSTNYADVAGKYIGTFQGFTQGQWALTVDNAGKVTGSLLAYSGGAAEVEGTVSASGGLQLSSPKSTYPAQSAGMITNSQVSGVWKITGLGELNFQGIKDRPESEPSGTYTWMTVPPGVGEGFFFQLQFGQASNSQP
ncbi:MAG: hypothetical protein Q7U02_07470 [Desulfosalsimonadaceae bacterium]|nr:hypothetical protein [Desulfosalsimonadaceae bacterium]